MDSKFHILLQHFFTIWLLSYRNVSQCTIASYRDAFRLYICWLAKEKDIPPDKINFSEITPQLLMEFAEYLEIVRHNSGKTVNCRINAFRSFAEFVLYEEPSLMAWAQSIKHMPCKKEKKPILDYLTSEEVGFMVRECSQHSPTGRRDGLLIRLLFNSGARISEIITLRFPDVEFNQERCCVILHGKGRKARKIPLWSETATALQDYIQDNDLSCNDWLFPGRNVAHLTRSGARSIIDKHAREATCSHPELEGKAITPHVFRHSAAMALLEAGVDLSTIAIWLGHESITTTHKYMVASLRLKEEALAQVNHAENAVSHRYHAEPSVLEFLKGIAR